LIYCQVELCFFQITTFLRLPLFVVAEVFNTNFTVYPDDIEQGKLHVEELITPIPRLYGNWLGNVISTIPPTGICVSGIIMKV